MALRVSSPHYFAPTVVKKACSSPCSPCLRSSQGRCWANKTGKGHRRARRVRPAELAILGGSGRALSSAHRLGGGAGRSVDDDVPQARNSRRTPARATSPTSSISPAPRPRCRRCATGDLDTAALAFSTFALGIVNAGMEDLRVLGDEFQDGVPGYNTNPFMVRNDSGDQDGRRFEGQGAGDQPGRQRGRHGAARHARQAPIQDKSDVTVIEARFPDQKAMLNEHKIDLTSSPAPFGFDPELTAFAHPLFIRPTRWAARR